MMCGGGGRFAVRPFGHSKIRLTLGAGTSHQVVVEGTHMLDLAGRMTAGTSVANCGPKTIANHIAPHIDDAAERAGRRVPRIVAMVAVCVTDDVEGVRSYGREQTRMYDTFPSYRRALDREGLESGRATREGSARDSPKQYAGHREW